MNPISLSARLLEDWQETVSFDSIIPVATGRWISANCWQKISNLFIHLKTVVLYIIIKLSGQS